MTRRLFAIALLPRGELASRVDGLRAAVGDPRLADLPTHLTLVPPIALDEPATATLPQVLRRVAAATEPFALELGPAASFAPRTMTLHLSVHGELDRLGALRAGLRVDPLDRPDEHDFVPHVTLLQRATVEQVGAGLALVTRPLGEWAVTALTLLERLRPESGAVWHPVAEEPLGGPHVVGRGGVELHLRSIATLEPSAADLVEPERDPTVALRSGGSTLVTVAEEPGRAGSAIGAVVGRADRLGAVVDHVVVDPAHRRQGVARQMVRYWCLAAARRGAATVVAERDPDDPDRATVADALGFVAADRSTWFRRVGPSGELGSAP